MSRLARKTIPLPPQTSVRLEDGFALVHGVKGEIKVPVLAGIKVAVEESALSVTIMDKDTQPDLQTRANLGTEWSLLSNAIQGVSQGFEKVMEIQGVGYRAQMEGTTLVLFLGFVNPVRYVAPSGVTIAVDKNIIRVSGVSKELVGRAAAEIRAFKKPEPYKGKGIRYQGEVIRMKAGKKSATGAK